MSVYRAISGTVRSYVRGRTAIADGPNVDKGNGRGGLRRRVEGLAEGGFEAVDCPTGVLGAVEESAVDVKGEAR
jgi:hypothetical protein